MIKIIIEVRGGLVQAVHSTDPDVQVRILDWDNMDTQNLTAQEVQMQNDIVHMKDVL